eukprot:UN02554
MSEIPGMGGSRSLHAPIRLLGAAPTPSSSTAPTDIDVQPQQNKEKDGEGDNIKELKMTPTPTDDDSNESTDEGNKNSPNNKVPKIPFSSLSASGPVFKFVSPTLKNKIKKKQPKLLRTKSCPEMKYDDCREFDSFSGEWVDSKGQNVLISPWGVIRYPNNPKLRFEAIFMGPHHLSVSFDKDPKRRKFVGKLNQECTLLIWSNETKWAKKGTKYDPKFQITKNKKRKNKNRSASCIVQ